MSKRKDRESIPEAEQGKLGITARNIDAQTAESLGMPEGIYIMKINDDTPVKNSELREKDIIVSFDDQAVKTITELQELLTYTRAGQEVSIKVQRLEGGEYVEKEFKVILDKNRTYVEKSTEESRQEESQQNNGNYNYDPFSDFDDIFRNFGRFGW